jgi:hypothetical protein
MAISLASIAKKTALKAPRIIYYAVPGFGKTTMAAGAPNPIFLLTEEGFGSLTDLQHFTDSDGEDVLTEWGDVKAALTALCTEEHEFKTIVIDTLDALESIIWRQVASEHNRDNIEKIDFGKGYKFALTYWNELLKALDWLRDNRGMTVVLIAHSEIAKYDAPDTEPYDRFVLNIHKVARPLLVNWCDVLLFGNYRVHVKTRDEGFGKKGSRGVGHGERVLYTGERPAYTAKNRFGLQHEIELPGDSPPDPVLIWGAFMQAMTKALGNEKEKENDGNS